MKIPVLMYHQIEAHAPKGTPLRGLVVRPQTFARHMALMSLLGYRGMSMGDLMPYLSGEKQGKVFGITFDDGYENNLRHAMPVLQKYGFSATCYIVSAAIGKTNLWDAVLGIPQVQLMNTQQLQQWRDGGQEVGCHSLSHASLIGIAPEKLSMEVVDARKQLALHLDESATIGHFCYPYGAHDDAATEAVRSAGYLTATTTVRGRLDTAQPHDLLRIPRILMSRSTTWVHLLLKCFTNYEDRRGERSCLT
jgi:hypothetical protein